MNSALSAEVRTVALSPHQVETTRNMRAYPDCATRYDLVYLCTLSASVDLDVLRGAIGDLVRRHAALRTTLSSTAQHVHSVENFAVPSCIEESPAAVTHRLARERLGLANVVSGRPLFRAELHRVPGSTLLSLRIHHLIYDGWSLSIIWRDLAELYRARLAGEQPLLPIPGTTYADFTEALRRERHSLSEAAVAHWKASTDGCPRKIPWRRPQAPVAPDTRVRTAVFPLPAVVFPAVRRVARECRVSPFTVALTVTGAAVAEVNGLEMVLVGNDDAARADAAVQDVVGLFVDTRLTPVPALQGRTLADLVRSVSEGWRLANRYPVAHVDQILDAIGRPELVKVGMSTMTTNGTNGLVLPGAEMTRIHVPRNTRYWRDLTVSWVAGERAVIEIAFRPSTVHREVPGAIMAAITEMVGQPASGK